MGKFLLLLGPSGVGKSTLINELRHIDDKFIYISPFITRELRYAETDKISISNEEMDSLSRHDDFLAINEIYGIRYATPKAPIIKALANNMYPVLDWPADKISIMKTAFKEKLFIAYIAPPSIEVLKLRLLADNRDVDGNRFQKDIEELKRYKSCEFDSFIDINVISDKNAIETAVYIYNNYISSLS